MKGNDCTSRSGGGMVSCEATDQARPGGDSGPDLPPPLIIPLQEVDERQRWLVGGKAASLGLLLRANLPVPAGFCVTVAAFKEFLNASANCAELSRLISDSSQDRSSRTQDLNTQATECLAAAPIPPPVVEALLTAWRAMGVERIYAVRSSATVEDAADHSCAGQFESVLNVQEQEALLAALKRCWLSGFSPRALAYHAKEGLPVEKTAVAVVVQEMVPAEVAGVLFTLDPVSGDSGRTVIEAVPGLGDQLVSGSAAPECVVLEKRGMRVLQRRASSARPSLDDSLARRLAGLGSEAERLFGRPLDIEWATAGGKLFLLQARPVTALPSARSWEERQIWSNLNTGEIFPDVTTPMTWSLVQLLLGPMFGSLFRLVGADSSRAPAVGLVAGRVYFNANTGMAALRPFRFLVGGLANLAQAIGGGKASEHARGLSELADSDLPDLGFHWPKYVLSWPRILYALITHAPHRGDAWIRGLKARTDELVRQEVESLSTRELVGFLNRILRGSFEGWELLYLGTQALVLPLFQKACRDWLDDPRLTLGYRLFAGLGGVPEAEAGLALWRLAAVAHKDAETQTIVLSGADWSEVEAQLIVREHGRQFLAAWGEFMAEHGYHCRGELELFNPRWCETPDYILDLVRGYLPSIDRSNADEKQRRLAEDRRRLTDECRRRLNPFKRWVFSSSLNRAQRLALNREEWKNQAVRQIFLIRRVLLTLGRRLHQQGALSDPGDIFFFELCEIEPVATGKPGFNVLDRVLSRRKEYERNLTLSPPSAVFGKFNPALRPRPPVEPGLEAKVIEGIPVSPGVVTGPARVILHTDAQAQVLPGEILVAPFTDPAWTPYFISAAGVVVDQGGVLSHGSIVARELGLPAVTNTVVGTQVIRTGNLLEVDANCGRVTILS